MQIISLIYINIMHIVFFDTKKSLIYTYMSYVKTYAKDMNATFVNADVEKLLCDNKIDALISPANSFGDMTGGIDKVYSKMFPNIEKTVKGMISKLGKNCNNRYYLPVGANISVMTGDPKCHFMVVMPTMFLPKNIKDTNCVYNAFYGLLLNYYDKQITLACPGLGTGIGGLSPEESVKQIINAFRDFKTNNPGI
jgi:O-acetyl-ADP-ribose deacetylase (regulator of RNase III)